MSLVITLGKDIFLPLRSIPVISSGLLNTPTLASIISDPESYCGHDYDTVLTVYSYLPGGEPLQVNHASFAPLQAKSKRESALTSCRHLPAAMMVRRSAALGMFNFLVYVVGGIPPARTIWNETPQLTPADTAFILEGLPTPRLNSAAELRARILAIVNDISHQVAHHGILIDKTAMPGTRGAWSQLIGDIDGKAARSPDTHADHFKALGLRWCRGSRPEQINPIRVALSRPPI
jgi:hypothetical protein